MKDKFIGGLLVFIGAASFGVLSSIVKTAYGAGYSLGQITTVQSFLGMAILWCLYLITKVILGAVHHNTHNKDKGAHNKVVRSKRDHYLTVIASGIFPGLVGILYYQSVQFIPASIAIILLMQYLWISVLIDVLFFKHRPSLIQVVAVILIIGGSIVAAGVLNESISFNLKGYLYGLAAALSYCFFIITSNRVGLSLPTLEKSALMITGAFIITALIFLPSFIQYFDLQNPSFTKYFNVLQEPLYRYGLILALLGTVIPPFLFAVGIPKVGISISAILSAVELPVAMLSSYFYLKEEISFLQWMGVLVILFAIVLANLRWRKKAI